MFGFEKRFGFIQSLITGKAGEFSELIAKNLSGKLDTVKIAAAGPSEAEENSARQTPDMIFPEDSGSVGDQLTDEIGGDGEYPASGAIHEQANEMSAYSAPPMQEMPSRFTEITAKHGSGGIFPAREIMKKKLNHFQIERLAEKIKERLETEIKVEKERRGEEP